MPETRSASTAAQSPWLVGPATDLTLGTGLLYLPILAALMLAGPGLRDRIPFDLVALLTLLFSTPHLGATLLRVYERSEDRRAYRWFALHLTLLIAALGLLGLYVPVVGSVLITFYLSVVAWHFTAQNYGIALVFLRRRGVEIAPPLKRWVYACFALPCLLWILTLHGERPGSVDYAPFQTGGTIYDFVSLQIPGQIQGPLLLGGIGAYLASLCVCLRRLAACGGPGTILPSIALIVTQAAWYAAPLLLRLSLPDERLGPLATTEVAFTFAWMTVLHSLQYLWITDYYLRKERSSGTTPRFLAKALLAGSALYGLPLLLLAPDLLGRLPYDAGLYLLVAGGLNLHHILLDSVIWKLRNASIARILIRGAAPSEAGATRPAGRSWLRPLIYASGALGVAFTLISIYESEMGYRAFHAGDLARLETATRRMAWIGYDSAKRRAALGFLRGQADDLEGALRELERSNALKPNAWAWLNIGVLRERSGDIAGAHTAYTRALRLEPDNPDARQGELRSRQELARRRRAEAAPGGS